MAVFLTNGEYYISFVGFDMIKTKDDSKAHDFRSLEKAINLKNSKPAQCRSYYPVTRDGILICSPADKTVTPIKKKHRKKIPLELRQKVYHKNKGHCYICGDFVPFDSFEVEHRIPLAKGGTNNIKNLFVSCHCCNTMKHDIYPKDLLQKITQILLYQTGKKHGKEIRWKIMVLLLRWMLPEGKGK